MTREPMVFIVDDDLGMRKSLNLVMKSAGLQTELYASAEEFLDDYDPEQPGCLVLDLKMPGMSGRELQEKLAAQQVRIPIVFLTGYGDVPTAVDAMRSGAVDFLQKPASHRDLLERVRKAIDVDTHDRQMRQEVQEIQDRFAALTPREREVLELVVAGFSNKQIADRLEISQKTVAHHRFHIMQKTGAANAADLARMVVTEASAGAK